jgi:hypothetical protein
MGRGRVLFAIAVASAVAACGGDRDAGRDAVVEWRVDPVPLLTIGRDEPDNIDATFERITGATRLADGSLLVADLGDWPLKLYGADGKFVRRVARKGTGPGEIEYLARLYRCGDRLFTQDIASRRISEFSLDGRYLSDFRFQVLPGQQVPYISACDERGRFAHLGWGALSNPVAGYHRDTVPVWLSATPDGAPQFVDSIASSERWGRTMQGRIVGTRPLPLGRQPSIAFGPGGLYIATGDAFEVLVYDTSGARLTPHRLSDSVAAVTPADVRDHIEAQVAEEGEQRRASVEREFGEITYPQRHAAITALVVDREGLLWLRSFVPPTAESVTWRVLDQNGAEVARVSLPRRMQLFEIGRDYVLGRELDVVEGVPVLKLLRLDRLP